MTEAASSDRGSGLEFRGRQPEEEQSRIRWSRPEAGTQFIANVKSPTRSGFIRSVVEPDGSRVTTAIHRAGEAHRRSEE